MRLLFPVVILALAASTPAAAKPALTNPDCPDAASHWARKTDSWRGKPGKPRKLAELPPAESYAAVLRRDERGCMIPVRYREVRR